MLGMGSNKSSSQDGSSVNLIGNGTTITGDVNCSGDVRIDGTLIGNLTTNGKFVLGTNGKIEGNVVSTNADLSGEVKGKVTITETLQLKGSAKINGDIVTGKLAIEAGALFTGTCNMGAVVRNMQSNTSRANVAETA